MTDGIKAGEIKIEYFPTLDMIGDYLSKLLQGSSFQKFSNLIIGMEEADITIFNKKSLKLIKNKKEKKSTITKSIKAAG